MIAEARQALHEQAAAETLSVWPENWHAVVLFDALRTQWRWAVGMGAQRLGLEYSALPIVRDAIEPRIAPDLRTAWPELFAQLQIMEAAVLTADAE